MNFRDTNQSISSGEIQRSISKVCDYTITKSLGGCNGQVYQVCNNRGELKVLKLFTEGNLYMCPRNPYEVSIASTFRHPNLMSCEELLILGENPSMLGVTMSCASMCLIDVMSSINVGFEQRLTYLHQTIKGLAFLHLNGYLHLDVKVDNVLIVRGVAQLADFGHSGRMDANGLMFSDYPLMTELYRPPELLKAKNHYTYSVHSESWTVGHLMVMTCFGRGFFPSECYKNQKKGVAFILNEFENQKQRLIYEMCCAGTSSNGSSVHSGSRIAPIMEPNERIGRLVTFLTSLFSTQPHRRLRAVDMVNDPLFQGLGGTEIKGELAPRVRYFTPPDTASQVERICGMLLEYWPSCSSRLLFLAVDLYIRSIAYTCHYGEGESVNRLRKVMAAVCCWLAHKMEGKLDTDTTRKLIGWCSSTPNEFNSMELKVIVMLKGDLSNNYLYEICTGANHLRLCYNTIVRGDPDVYVDLDLQKWKEMMGEPMGNPYLTIAELHANLH